jgi:hypothetical protein
VVGRVTESCATFSSCFALVGSTRLDKFPRLSKTLLRPRFPFPERGPAE